MARQDAGRQAACHGLLRSPGHRGRGGCGRPISFPCSSRRPARTTHAALLGHACTCCWDTQRQRPEGGRSRDRGGREVRERGPGARGLGAQLCPGSPAGRRQGEVLIPSGCPACFGARPLAPHRQPPCCQFPACGGPRTCQRACGARSVSHGCRGAGPPAPGPRRWEEGQAGGRLLCPCAPRSHLSLCLALPSVPPEPHADSVHFPALRPRPGHLREVIPGAQRLPPRLPPGAGSTAWPAHNRRQGRVSPPASQRSRPSPADVRMPCILPRPPFHWFLKNLCVQGPPGGSAVECRPLAQAVTPGPGIESCTGFPAGSLPLPLPGSLPLSLSLMSK